MIALAPTITAGEDLRAFDVVYLQGNKAYRWTPEHAKKKIYAQRAVRFAVKEGEVVEFATVEEVQGLLLLSQSR